MKMALVGYITVSGIVDAKTLYITPVDDLSTKKRKIVNLATGTNGVKIFSLIIYNISVQTH